MKSVRVLLAMLLGTFLTFVGVAASPAAAGPYPPSTCPQLGVSTTTPFPGQQITVTGSGFVAGESVTLILDTSATVLGHVTVSGDGTFSTTVTIPENFTGIHTIKVLGDTSGCPVDPIQITVQGHGPSGGPGGPAFTGFDALLAVVIALALIAAGVTLSRSGRRRRHHAAH
jgi:hypothetical protein